MDNSDYLCRTKNWTSQGDVHLWTILFRCPYLYCFFFLAFFDCLYVYHFLCTISMKDCQFLLARYLPSCWLDIYLQINRYPYLYCSFFLPFFYCLCLPFSLYIVERLSILVGQIFTFKSNLVERFATFICSFCFSLNSSVQINLFAPQLILEDKFYRTLEEVLIKDRLALNELIVP